MTYFGSTRFNYLRPYSSTGSVPEAEEGKRVTPHSDFFFLLSRRESAILKFRQRVRSLDASHSVARGGGVMFIRIIHFPSRSLLAIPTRLAEFLVRTPAKYRLR